MQEYTKEYSILVYRIPYNGTPDQSYKFMQISTPQLPEDMEAWIEELGGHSYEVTEILVPVN